MKKTLFFLIVVLLSITGFAQNSRLGITAKANAGTSNQANNDLVVANGANILNLSSSTISCISSTRNNTQVYKITIEDDYDNNGRIDQVTFDLVAAAHTRSTYSFNDNQNSSTMTRLGPASEVSIVNNVWGIDNDGDIDAGETIVFTVQNLSTSNLSSRYELIFDGFNVLGLYETNGGNTHRIIKGEGRNLSSYTINFSKDEPINNEQSITLTGAGSGTTNEIREWGLSSIGLSISIKDSQSTGIDDLSDYSLFSNASNFGGPYPAQTREVKKSQFCWDKVPRWLAVRNVDPLTEAEVTDLAEHYQIVLLEKANNQGKDNVEDGMVSLATRLKAKNPDITTLFYWNTWINYGGYKANEGYNPAWSDLDSNGNPILFKDLYFTYNYDVKALRDWWIKIPVDAMKNDVLDGVFVDKVVSGAFKDIFPNGRPINNYVRMMQDLYEAMPEGKMLIGNTLRSERVNGNRALMEVMDGSYLERWAFPGRGDIAASGEAEAIAISIQSMREALSKGKAIHFQTSPHDTGGEEPSDFAGRVQYAKDNVKFPLAVYLIVAEENAYFSYQSQVNAKTNAKQVWNTSFIDEFSYKLGEPLGPPTKDGFVYQRSYENVDVWVNVETREARLDWKDKTKITTTECSASSCGDFDAFKTIEAEDFCDQKGIRTESSSEGGQNVGYIDNGDWIKFDDVNFGQGASSVDLRVASISSGGTIEFRLGSTSGTLVGSVSVPNTGGWQTWETISTPINSASGTKDVYLVFTKGFNLNWIRFKENPNTPTPTNGTLVHMTKRNAKGFAIDGNKGGVNNQNIYLYSSSSSNVNQQWNEIDRGNGYYSYQKANTNFCIDGDNGGSNGQNVFLFECQNNNQDQHWRKVNVGGGSFRLEKRNAPGFSLDGGADGANTQNLYLWKSNDRNQNQHWTFGDATKSNTLTVENSFVAYPNPFSDMLNIQFDLSGSPIRLEIISMTGQVVLSRMITDSSDTSLDLSYLSNGVYIAKATNANFSEELKIIKN